MRKNVKYAALAGVSFASTLSMLSTDHGEGTDSGNGID
jgi:hypothetical protein